MDNMMAIIASTPWWFWPLLACSFYIILVFRMFSMSMLSMAFMPVAMFCCSLYMFVKHVLITEYFPEATTHFAVCMGLFALGTLMGVCKEFLFGQEYEIDLKAQSIRFINSPTISMMLFMGAMGFGIFIDYLYSVYASGYPQHGFITVCSSFMISGIFVGRTYFYLVRCIQHERASKTLDN